MDQLSDRGSLCVRVPSITFIISTIVLSLSILSINTLQESLTSKFKSNKSGWLYNDVSSASQGKLWKPVVIRKFSARHHKRRNPYKKSSRPHCERWSVVTTIFEPSDLLFQLRDLRDWCLVVVGDRKTNDSVWADFQTAKSNKTVYLSPKDQENLGYSSLKFLPWNHFGRKNVGYLYAIQHGAQFIWDTDDDNVLRDPPSLTALTKTLTEDILISTVDDTHHLWNPYPSFNAFHPRTALFAENAWPRGFPLQYIRDASASSMNHNAEKTHISKLAVVQSLANNDPDVDAIFRLSRSIPMSFRTEMKNIRALPGNRMAPYNAQATMWLRKAMFAMVLPVTVHGRVTDIWRSYISQRLFVDQQMQISFSGPHVNQFRNVHALLADLQSEVPLYTQTDELIKWIRQWKPRHLSLSLKQKMIQLYVDMYEIGVIEEDDVRLAHAWLDDLESFGLIYNSSVREEKNNRNVRPALSPTLSDFSRVAVCIVENSNRRDFGNNLPPEEKETDVFKAENTGIRFDVIHELRGVKSCHQSVERKEFRRPWRYNWIILIDGTKKMTGLPALEQLALNGSSRTIWTGTSSRCCCNGSIPVIIGERNVMDTLFRSEYLPLKLRSSRFLLERGIMVKEHEGIHLCG